MKRIAIIILLLLGGLSYTSCYGRGLRGIFKRSVTIECYRVQGSYYPWDTCVIDMVDCFYDIMDSLESKGESYAVSKVDPEMEFYYRIENKKVYCYKSMRKLCLNGEYASRRLEDYFVKQPFASVSSCLTLMGKYTIKI